MEVDEDSLEWRIRKLEEEHSRQTYMLSLIVQAFKDCTEENAKFRTALEKLSVCYPSVPWELAPTEDWKAHVATIEKWRISIAKRALKEGTDS